MTFLPDSPFPPFPPLGNGELLSSLIMVLIGKKKGTLSWWGPQYIAYLLESNRNLTPFLLQNKVRSNAHYPKYDNNVCSKLFLYQEQNNFRSCRPWGLRDTFSVNAARNLTTSPKGKNIRRNFGSCSSLGVRSRFWVVKCVRTASLGLSTRGRPFAPKYFETLTAKCHVLFQHFRMSTSVGHLSSKYPFQF